MALTVKYNCNFKGEQNAAGPGMFYEEERKFEHPSEALEFYNTCISPITTLHELFPNVITEKDTSYKDSLKLLKNSMEDFPESIFLGNSLK